MKGGDPHASDQELLMTADGELSTGKTAQIRAHLASCWECRTRMAEIECTISDFVKLHHQGVDPQLPPIDGARAMLKAQLSDAVQKPRRVGWWSPALYPEYSRSLVLLRVSARWHAWRKNSALARGQA
jgi:anti-sigma factor RsiW